MAIAAPEPTEPDARIIDQSLKDANWRLYNKCAQLWGTAEAELPAKKIWVAYDKDWISRGHVDFEHGNFAAQALVDADKADDIAAALALLRKRLGDAQTNTPSDMADDDKVLKLARQLARERGLKLAEPTAPAVKGDPVLAGILPPDAESRLTAERLQQTPVTGDDGKPRIMLTYRVDFLDGYFRRLAARYSDAVRREARRFELPPALIFAIIETESAFNPRARSAVPAFGLMQLVPGSGGRDAHKFAFGSPRTLDPEYFYIPKNNILLGSAYLALLGGSYLRGINNPTSRRYAVIAAYNTGLGNVAKIFAGTMNMVTAAEAINKMSPDEVFRHLQKNLPRYITNVIVRQGRYDSMDA